VRFDVRDELISTFWKGPYVARFLSIVAESLSQLADGVGEHLIRNERVLPDGFENLFLERMRSGCSARKHKSSMTRGSRRFFSSPRVSWFRPGWTFHSASRKAAFMKGLRAFSE